MSKIIDLGGEGGAFARGGNRLCYVHPNNSDQCIKVLRPDRAPELKRQFSGFPRKLKPLKYFDDNLQERAVYQQIDRSIGELAYQLIPRCFGFADTNFGPGLISEIICDTDGLISLSLKQTLWQQGMTSEISQLIADFCAQWSRLGMPSRNLLLHNIVVQRGAGKCSRLVVIDGLGWSNIIPLGYWVPAIARKQARRKAGRLMAAAHQLLENKRNGVDWGYHGWLDDENRTRKT